MFKKFIPTHRTVYIVIAVLLVVGGFIFRSWYESAHSPKKVVVVGTPINGPANARTAGSTVAKSPAQASGDRNIGSSTDTRGQSSSNTSASQWVSSASGAITVKQPLADTKFSDGSVLGGSAKVGQVQYRLKDNNVGVISRGTLNVTDGNFSGIIHFSSQGTGGQLDVFSTDSQGVEYDEVQINVRF
jgi:hypothetical protein